MALTDRSHPFPAGTWTIDPGASIITVASRTLRLWTTTGRRHGFGAICLDELPPVGVIRFHQPSGRPVLTMVLDPPDAERGAPDLDALGGGPDVAGLRWTLRSESLEILPGGTWRIMATLTARGRAGLVELLLEVDPAASRRDLLVLRGGGVLDRRALGMGRRAVLVGPRIQLELAMQATRAAGDEPTGQLTEDGRTAHTRLLRRNGRPSTVLRQAGDPTTPSRGRGRASGQQTLGCPPSSLPAGPQSTTCYQARDHLPPAGQRTTKIRTPVGVPGHRCRAIRPEVVKPPLCL
jgi:hypothetical protein